MKATGKTYWLSSTTKKKQNFGSTSKKPNSYQRRQSQQKKARSPFILYFISSQIYSRWILLNKIISI